MAYCGKCGSLLKAGDAFCSKCGAKIPEEDIAIQKNEPTEKNGFSTDTAQEVSEKVEEPLFIGRYSGQKWFLKIPYKIYVTDVYIEKEDLLLYQGSGAFSASSRVPVYIKRNTVRAISTKNKFSVSNTVLAVGGMLFALLIKGAELFVSPIGWGLMIACAVAFFVGKTAVVEIHHRGGVYEIPTEFMSEAEELKNKLTHELAKGNNSNE